MEVVSVGPVYVVVVVVMVTVTEDDVVVNVVVDDVGMLQNTAGSAPPWQLFVHLLDSKYAYSSPFMSLRHPAAATNAFAQLMHILCFSPSSMPPERGPNANLDSCRVALIAA